MKLSIKSEQLKYLIPAMGAVGLVLRVILYATGIDGRGLLEKGHWAEIGTGILTLLVLAAAFLATRSLPAAAAEAERPASVSAAIGAFAAMAGIGVTTVSEFAEFSSRLHLIVWLLGLGSAIALGCTGFCRLTGRKSSSLLSVVVCLYFALRLVSRYQLWSAVPQLQDYCFLLTAYAALMLTAYHHAAADAGTGNHRALWFYSLIAVYLCCLSLTERTEFLLMLGCGMWALANLTCPVKHVQTGDCAED